MEAHEQQEIVDTLQHLFHEFEDLAVGGLRTLGPERVAQLEQLKDAFQRSGSLHLANRLEILANAIKEDSRLAGDALMRAQASVRMFDRILTLEMAESQLIHGLELQQANEEE